MVLKMSKTKKKNTKKQNHETPIKVPAKEIMPFLDNPFCRDFQGSSIIYSNDFYIALYKKISEENMTYVEAYNALGFDTKVLGENRANSAGKRAVQMAKEDRLFAINPANYRGNVPREMMGNLSPEEELAYLKARNLYLETVIEIQKKTRLELAAMNTSLKQKKST